MLVVGMNDSFYLTYFEQHWHSGLHLHFEWHWHSGFHLLLDRHWHSGLVVNILVVNILVEVAHSLPG